MVAWPSSARIPQVIEYPFVILNKLTNTAIFHLFKNISHENMRSQSLARNVMMILQKSYGIHVFTRFYMLGTGHSNHWKKMIGSISIKSCDLLSIGIITTVQEERDFVLSFFFCCNTTFSTSQETFLFSFGLLII